MENNKEDEMMNKDMKNPLNDGNMMNEGMNEGSPMMNKEMPMGDMSMKDNMGMNDGMNNNMNMNDKMNMNMTDNQEMSFFQKNKKMVVGALIICVVVIIALVLFVFMSGDDEGSDGNLFLEGQLEDEVNVFDNGKKISYTGVLETALLSYNVQNGSYPPVLGIASGECADISVLESHLSSYLPRFDFSNPDHFYCVHNPDNPQAYILGVIGIEENHPILENDIDGNAGNPFIIQGPNSREKCGITSSDTVYCVGAGTVSNNTIDAPTPSFDDDLYYAL